MSSIPISIMKLLERQDKERNEALSRIAYLSGDPFIINVSKIGGEDVIAYSRETADKEIQMSGIEPMLDRHREELVRGIRKALQGED